MELDEYKEIAICAIRRYLNSKDDNATIETKYSLAIKRLVIKAQESDVVRINGVTSYSTNEQSYSFNEKDTFAITPDIAILLPKKKNFYAW